MLLHSLLVVSVATENSLIGSTYTVGLTWWLLISIIIIHRSRNVCNYFLLNFRAEFVSRSADYRLFILILRPTLIHVILVLAFTTAKYTDRSAGNKYTATMLTYFQRGLFIRHKLMHRGHVCRLGIARISVFRSVEWPPQLQTAGHRFGTYHTISITISMLVVSLIPVDINAISWWIVFSAGLNLLYNGSCKGTIIKAIE